MKKFIAIFLATLMLFTLVAPVGATDSTADTAVEESTSSANIFDLLRDFFHNIIIGPLTVLFNCNCPWCEGPHNTSNNDAPDAPAETTTVPEETTTEPEETTTEPIVPEEPEEIIYPDYPGQIVVDSAEAAQEALKNAVSGTVIKLAEGVDYGILTVCADVVLDSKDVAVPGSETTVQGNYFFTDSVDKYGKNEFVRMFENITIVGAKGATLDGIEFATGTFKLTKSNGKQTGTMYRFVEVKNLVIDSVDFTDKSTLGQGTGFSSPLFLDLQSVHVSGITVKNCRLNGENTKMNFVYAYGNAAKDCVFGYVLNNVAIINNTVSGIARLCNLREAENVSIMDNKVKNLSKEFALFENNTDMTYSGQIILSGNKADTFAGFFLRIGIVGKAHVTVINNTIINCGRAELYPEYAAQAFVYNTGATEDNIPVIKDNIVK